MVEGMYDYWNGKAIAIVVGSGCIGLVYFSTTSFERKGKLACVGMILLRSKDVIFAVYALR